MGRQQIEAPLTFHMALAYFCDISSFRGGSRAGSLGGAQQLTGGGGVVADIFRVVSTSRAAIQWGGG